jgi:hypothetical protein
MLLLPGPMVEAWEPSTKQSSIGNRGELDRKFSSTVKIKDWMQTNAGKTRRTNLNVKVTAVGNVTACEAFN